MTAATAAPAGLGTVDVAAAIRRVVTGNWIGSAGVAAVILGTAGVLSAVVGLLAKPEDFGIDNTLTLVAVILAGTFGADFVASGSGSGFDESWDLAISISAFPLTITILALAAGVLAFQRLVRNYPRPGAALGDAVRVALLVALPLFVLALVLRSDLDELGRGWFAQAAAEMEFGDDATWGAGQAGAIFLPLVLVAFVLALTCIAHRDWWTGRARAVVEWVAPSLHGLAAIVVLLPLSGLVGIGLLMFGDDRVDEEIDSDDAIAVWSGIAAFVANGGFALLGLGSGAPVGTADREHGSDGTDASNSDWHRLAWHAGDGGNEPGLWAAPLVLLVMLVFAALAVASATRDRSQLLRNLLCWTGSLLVVVPVLARVANGHVVFSVESGADDYESSATVGVEGAQTTVLVAAIALLVSLGVALARGGLDPAQLKAALRRIQANPGRPQAPGATQAPPPPPPGPPPSGPPPVS